ncbi:MAG TPA: UDP-glucose 4-epimerase GalE [Smithellaceae bacterium]|nr:UDP-glucose 4-epimerase GalE [Smithellaceae bacterium]
MSVTVNIVNCNSGGTPARCPEGLAAQTRPPGHVLITGGTGYIGSHTIVALISAGYDPVIVDNLSNSKISVLDRIEAITGKRPPFYEIDLRDRAALDAVFQKHSITAAIHFAGLKAVGESVAEPLRYYENNIESTLSLCFVMAARGVKRLVFSSSATVYGDPHTVPIREDFPLAPANPYGRTKLMIEQILQDLYASDSAWQIALLRYFNPVGAHPSGLIGEDPGGHPNNLMPYISQVAVGRRERLSVFGGNYPTPDGTGVRDYIHVMDLAEGHVAALRHMEKADPSFQHSMSFPRRRESSEVPSSTNTSSFPRRRESMPLIVNLGTGRGYSVLEILHAFEKAAGKAIPYQITDRRPGDIAACYADPTLAKKLFGWKAARSLEDMCADTWRWQSQNPKGYE